jgi:hypothetical protein
MRDRLVQAHRPLSSRPPAPARFPGFIVNHGAVGTVDREPFTCTSTWLVGRGTSGRSTPHVQCPMRPRATRHVPRLHENNRAREGDFLTRALYPLPIGGRSMPHASSHPSIHPESKEFNYRAHRAKGEGSPPRLHPQECRLEAGAPSSQTPPRQLHRGFDNAAGTAGILAGIFSALHPSPNVAPVPSVSISGSQSGSQSLSPPQSKTGLSLESDCNTDGPVRVRVRVRVRVVVPRQEIQRDRRRRPKHARSQPSTLNPQPFFRLRCRLRCRLRYRCRYRTRFRTRFRGLTVLSHSPTIPRVAPPNLRGRAMPIKPSRQR